MVACTVTSSAVVGSSATKTEGSQAKAMAIITLCFWPPLNSWGYLFKVSLGDGNSTSVKSSITF